MSFDLHFPGGMWPVRASARQRVGWDTERWKSTALNTTEMTVKPREWTTETAAINTNLMIRRFAVVTVTPACGSTRPGQR